MRGLAFGLSCIAALGSGAVIAKGAAPVGPASRAHGAAPAAATVCQGCHGAHGEGNPAARIPRLAGQAADYLEKELRDYASGARRNEIMQNFAKPLSDADRGAIAAYFASQKAAYAKVEPGATDTQLATNWPTRDRRRNASRPAITATGPRASVNRIRRPT
jgi:cytochrome c553